MFPWNIVKVFWWLGSRVLRAAGYGLLVLWVLTSAASLAIGSKSLILADETAVYGLVAIHLAGLGVDYGH